MILQVWQGSFCPVTGTILLGSFSETRAFSGLQCTKAGAGDQGRSS